MANRISVTEFMRTEDPAGRALAGESRDGIEADASDHAYFLLDDSRVMLLGARRYKTQ